MNIDELLPALHDLHLPKGEYAVFGSATLAVRGLRAVPNIDIIVTNSLWEKLKETYQIDSEGFIRLGVVKISNWWFAPTRKDLPTLIKEAEIIRDTPFVRLEEVRAYKKLLNREKDNADVVLIDTFLSSLATDDEPIGLGIGDYEQILNLFKREVTAAVGDAILTMILFGSASRGQAKGSSDLDIFVVYDDSKITRNDVNEKLITIILNLRSTKEYQKLAARNIYPEIYPFLISSSKAHDTLWVMFDATISGIVLKDTKGYGEKMLGTLSEKIRNLGGKRSTLPNGKWCWLLYSDFSQVKGKELPL